MGLCFVAKAYKQLYSNRPSPPSTPCCPTRTHRPATPIYSYYRTDGSNRMTDLGYKASERDRAVQPYTWESAYRFSRGLEVG